MIEKPPKGGFFVCGSYKISATPDFLGIACLKAIKHILVKLMNCPPKRKER